MRPSTAVISAVRVRYWVETTRKPVIVVGWLSSLTNNKLIAKYKKIIDDAYGPVAHEFGPEELVEHTSSRLRKRKRKKQTKQNKQKEQTMDGFCEMIIVRAWLLCQKRGGQEGNRNRRYTCDDDAPVPETCSKRRNQTKNTTNDN
jgi:hypothetical protein